MKNTSLDAVKRISSEQESNGITGIGIAAALREMSKYWESHLSNGNEPKIITDDLIEMRNSLGNVISDLMIANGDLNASSPKLNEKEPMKKCDVFIEAIDNGEIGDGPTFGKIAADDAFCKKLLALKKMCIDNNVNEVHTDGSVDSWGPGDVEDELRLREDKLVVTKDSFWFSAVPKHADYTIETRSQGINGFISLIKNSQGSDLFLGENANELKEAAARASESYSLDEAALIASAKSNTNWKLIFGLKPEIYTGKVIDSTEHHIIINLDSRSTIHCKRNLDIVPVQGEVVSLNYSGSGAKAKVSKQAPKKSSSPSMG